MRILQLTAGTGSFHCGTCLRDAALVEELRKLGHDAMLAPLYLPLVLEGGVDARPVHMGGINAYLAERRLRLPRFVQDWLDSPRVLTWAARRGEMTQASQLGAMTVSMLEGAGGEQEREIGKLCGWLATLERPDVVLLSNALLLGLARPLRARLGVPILCTLQGEAPFLDALAEPHRARAWELAAAHARDVTAFLAVSGYTAELMRARLALPPERVHVIPNGIDPRPYAAVERAPDAPPTIGYVARLHRDKGLVTLVDAFARLAQRPEHRDLRLVAAGATLASDRPHLAALRARLRAEGLEPRVELRSNVSFAEKLDVLRRATVFSVPATYGESFGLYLLEAWATGLPVVQPAHGAFPELLAATGGGLTCAPDDPAALADALHALLTDRERARALGASGRRAVHERFNGERMAREVERVCRMAAPESTAAALVS
jgi:glycosyltransferase involved in cell wall biosynthesis